MALGEVMEGVPIGKRDGSEEKEKSGIMALVCLVDIDQHTI